MKKRVFVAEDDPTMTEVLQLSLEDLPDVELSFFDNGLSLYRAIQAEPPDVLLTDIMLPKLEGLAVARLVKFDEKYRHVLVMVISSVMDRDLLEQVKAVKADEFLAKPFRPQDLQDRMAALLAR